MTSKLFKLAVGAAWIGLALATASPAEGLAATTQLGVYASCSGSINPTSMMKCGVQYSYVQVIKFGGIPCSSGGCVSSNSAYCNMPYSPGRKTAYQEDIACVEPGWRVFALGPCAC